jgi:hypothetical protein
VFFTYTYIPSFVVGTRSKSLSSFDCSAKSAYFRIEGCLKVGLAALHAIPVSALLSSPFLQHSSKDTGLYFLLSAADRRILTSMYLNS